MGAALPDNGGEYQLLGRIYHPALGFCAGWVSLVAGFSAPIAAASLAFGHYAGAVLPGVSPLFAAVLLLGLFTTTNLLDVRTTGIVQNLFTLGQVVLIVGLIGLGLSLGEPAQIAAGGAVPLGAALASPAFAVGLIYVSFSYSGWNAAAYVAGEMREPGRNVPRALLLGAGAVVLLYVLLNVVFLGAVEPAALAGVVEVGHVAASALLGPAGGAVLSVTIALGLAASVGALIFTGARIYEAMGRRYPRLGFLAVRSRREAPVHAVLLQSAVALVLIVTASFDALLLYVGLTLSLFTGLTVAGVFVLRRSHPELARPYRVLGYPLTPLVYLALVVWAAVHTVSERPVVALAGAITLLLGLVLYLWVRPREARARPWRGTQPRSGSSRRRASSRADGTDAWPPAG